MAIQDLMNYNQTLTYLNRSLELWGQSCTVFIPQNIAMLGYENQTKQQEEAIGVSGISNRYTIQRRKIWINFTVNKSVYYRFNWFPEDADELCMAIMMGDSTIREDAYIRTAIPEQTSIWGDMIFQVKKIQDVGKFKTLQRLYFLKPTNNADLYADLELRWS